MRKLWNMKGLGKIVCMLFLVAALLMGCQGEVLDDSYSDQMSEDTYLEDESSYHDDLLQEEDDTQSETLDEDGSYTSKEEVAAYLNQYQHLPSNFITKKEAKSLGWESSKGNLGEVAPGMSIGGDRFGNYEGILPQADGRKYYECDIDFEGGYRDSKRIVYSNDGLIYYTEDHYETFELLYGEE